MSVLLFQRSEQRKKGNDPSSIQIYDVTYLFPPFSDMCFGLLLDPRSICFVISTRFALAVSRHHRIIYRLPRAP